MDGENSRMMIFGNDSKEVSAIELRTALGYLNSKSLIWSGNVKQNIDVDSNITKEQIKKNLEEDEVYEEISDGLMVKALHFFGFFEVFKESMNMDEAVQEFISVKLDEDFTKKRIADIGNKILEDDLRNIDNKIKQSFAEIGEESPIKKGNPTKSRK